MSRRALLMAWMGLLLLGDEWLCPKGKVEVRDCTSSPCKVECQ